ncbi:MAG: hypothetical protein AAB541_02675 [Patescibacteria group bacterium]
MSDKVKGTIIIGFAIIFAALLTPLVWRSITDKNNIAKLAHYEVIPESSPQLTNEPLYMCYNVARSAYKQYVSLNAISKKDVADGGPAYYMENWKWDYVNSWLKNRLDECSWRWSA